MDVTGSKACRPKPWADSFCRSRNNRLEFEKDVHRVVDVNLLGNIHLLTLYLPLLQRGQAKKAVVITSGLGDLDFTNLLRLDHQTVTSMAKAALNMIVAKFAAQSSRNHDGILYFAMSPGAVDTANVYFERGMFPSADDRVHN